MAAQRASDPRLEWALVAAATALALGLRLPDVGVYWLNPDEGIYYSMARWEAWEPFWEEFRRNTHPPAFYLGLRLIALTGADFVWMRVPAMLCGVAAVPAFHWLARTLGGPACGVLAAFTVALAPGMVLQSQLIRPYTAVVLALALAMLGLTRFLQRRDGASLLLAGAASLAAVVLHYAAVPVLACAAVGTLVEGTARRLPVREIRRLAVAMMPAVVATAVFAALHVATLDVATRAQQDWIRPYFAGSVGDLGAAWLGSIRYAVGPGDLAALLLLAVGLVTAARRGRGFWIVFPIACVAVASTLSLAHAYPLGPTRHGLPWLVALVPPASLGAVALLGAPVARRVVGAGSLALLIVFSEPIWSLLGRDEVAPVPSIEQPTLRRDVEQITPLLERARRESGALFTDRQTYTLLMPYFAAAREAQRIDADSGIVSFDWGRSVVVVSPRLLLRADATAPTRRDHALGFLLYAEESLPELALSQRSRGAYVFGGWGVPRFRSLPRVERQLADGPSCLFDPALRPGFGWALLDPARCLARLRSSVD